ncbi:MAG: recombination protein O N-terminal domain-containing protein, partial [bacterium]
MNNFKLEAIILSRREFGEADAYLTVFSKEEGKLSLLAKGIRRVSSRRAPHLETFSRSEIYV